MVECQPQFDIQSATKAVVVVGDGRGFVIAVLCVPADLSPKEILAFEELVESSDVVSIGDATHEDDNQSGWMLSLDHVWSKCSVMPPGYGPCLWVSDAQKGILGGMSGSPLLADTGHAIGLITCSIGPSGDEVDTEGGPFPRLTYCLPGRLLT